MAKTTKYIPVEDNEWVYPKLKDYHFACCDCGLVHAMDFEVILVGTTGEKKGNDNVMAIIPIQTMDPTAGLALRIRARRDNRRTAGLRRHHKYQK